MPGPTLLQIRRTSVADREANTITLPDAGTLALNILDGRAFSTNGAVVFEIGANTKNCRVSNSFFVGNDTINVFANSTIIKLANSTVNTHISVPTSAQYTGDYYLHANGSWVQVTAGPGGATTRVYQSFTATGGQTVYTVSGGYDIDQIDVFENGVHLANTEYTQDGSAVTLTTGSLVGAIIEVVGYKDLIIEDVVAVPAGANTQVQFNDSDAMGGTAGFTFDKATNNAVIANTLTVGTATINSSNYSQTANNALNLGGTAAASYQLNSTLAANVATLASNSTTYIPVTNGMVSNSTGVWITANAGLLTNTTGLHIGTGNGIVVDTDSIRVLANTGTVVNVTGIFVNATYIATLDANNALFLGGTSAASYQLNSTLAANVATLTANNATWHGTSVFANSTGAYPTSNSVGAVIGNTISRVIITGNSATFISTLAAGDTTITGFVNATVSINSAAHTTAGFLANATHVVPTSNSSGQTFGNTISRWVMTANSLTVSGGASPDSNTLGTALGSATQRWVALANTVTVSGGVSPDSNTLGTALGTTTQRWVITGNSATFTSTLAAGDTTITGFVNATVSVNSALFTTTGFKANTTGIFPTSNSSGQNFGNTISRWTVYANTIDLTSSITANGALGTGSQILTSNSLGGVYWASPSGGGNVTKVGTPADDQVGVWTGDGTIEGTAGFTFSAASNNATIANTLTVGSATINSTNYSQTANDALNLGGTAAASYQLNSTLAANVATLDANTAKFLVGANVVSNTTGLYPLSNTSGDEFGNTTARWVITANTSTLSGGLTIGSSITANTTGIFPASNTVGDDFGNTIARWTITANSLTLSGTTTLASQSANSIGFYPTSNTVGQLFGNTIARWEITGNTSTLSGGLTSATVNATTSVNSALVTVGTAFVANTIGAYHTGTVNAASFTVGTSTIVNSTMVSVTAGSLLSANIQINAQTGTTYTIVATDSGKVVTMNNAGAMTVTLPAGLPMGFRTQVLRLGAGTCTISNTGQTSCNMLSRTAAFAITAQYATASVFQTATANTYIVDGSI